jgi:hypothetical protein
LIPSLQQPRMIVEQPKVMEQVH